MPVLQPHPPRSPPPSLQLKLVRITHRVCEAYYARIYLSKVRAGARRQRACRDDVVPVDTSVRPPYLSSLKAYCVLPYSLRCVPVMLVLKHAYESHVWAECRQ